MSVRPTWRVLARRTLSTNAKPAAPASVKPPSADDEGPRYSPVELKLEKMKQVDKNMIFGKTEDLPAPVLPENPAEISALDPAQRRHSILPDGTRRIVHIRQGRSSTMQSPKNKELIWTISFQDEGEVAECWTNPLMGWVSGADPMASTMHNQLFFNTASEAVYFAQKRGWDYVVEPPILRAIRRDDVQYQDNFLPQHIASKVQMERTQCKHWERPKACTSHYMRPLTYHGDGIVKQYGPNPDKETAKHVEGIYKMR